MQPREGFGLAFVLSTPRAGSTLLAAMLGSHSQVLCPPEPWLLLPLAALRDDRLLVSTAYDHAFATRAIRELLAPDVLDRAFEAYARTAYEELLTRSGRRVFVDKTPRYYQILPFIDRLFPDALQIWIRRNPLDAIASCIDTWKLPLDELLGEGSAISPYSFDVTVSLQLLIDHFGGGGERKLIMDYGDLVRNPVVPLTSICGRLGLAFEPGMIDYGENRALVDTYRRATLGDRKLLEAGGPHTRSLDRWRSGLSPDDVARIVRTLGTRVFEDAGFGAPLEAALSYAQLDRGEVEAEGRLPELLELYRTYGTGDLRWSEVAGMAEKPEVQYTLLGRQNAQLKEAADERLRLIERLDADLRRATAELEAKERVIAELRTLDEGRLRTIPALDQQHVEAAAGPPEGEGSQLSQVLASMSEQRQLLQRVEEDVHRLTSLMGDFDVTGERDQFVRARRLAEEVADARLRVIQEQQRAIERYQRLHPAELFSRWFGPRIGQLHQYPARPLIIPARYRRVAALSDPPSISIVTPSLNQGTFIERTIRSVLEQGYPCLQYVIKDAGSSDETPTILERYEPLLAGVESASDTGFANGINQGFRKATGEILAYINSDDLLLPGTLHYVARFFAEHPDVDVVYGHRVVIDEYDAEIGRWVLPGHDDEVLSWADYVPQETLFWRRGIWEKVGGALDESFRFAVDWDLLLRFRDAGARMRRLPRFLGAFRVHPHQKTSREMNEIGESEMSRLRERCHGRQVTPWEVQRALRPYLRRHFYYHRLYRLGVLRY